MNGRTSKHRIFLVDDHPVTREGLASLIRLQPDLEVCGQAGSVAQALSALTACEPDLVELRRSVDVILRIDDRFRPHIEGADVSFAGQCAHLAGRHVHREDAVLPEIVANAREKSPLWAEVRPPQVA